MIACKKHGKKYPATRVCTKQAHSGEYGLAKAKKLTLFCTVKGFGSKEY